MSKRDDVDMASFRYFAEHFLGYIESGAQSTELSRRMVMRFKAPAEDNTKELIFCTFLYSNLASICLNILSKKNDNVFKEIYENIDAIKVKLVSQGIKDNISEIIEKAEEHANRKKAGLKFQKQHVDEVKKKLEKFIDTDFTEIRKRSKET